MSVDMASVAEIDSINLPVPPCCIEFWPADTSFFIIGTYLLKKDEPQPHGQAREGSLILLRIEQGKISIVHTLKTKFAVLDLHFHPFHATFFTASTSTGSLALYQMHYDSETQPRMIPRFVLQIWEPTILVTSFAWNPYYRNKLAASLATGEIVHCYITSQAWTEGLRHPDGEEQEELTDIERQWFPTETLYSHDMEAWTVAFTPNGKDIVSGGDDAVVRGIGSQWSAQSQENNEGKDEIKWTSKNLHGAGVTAVLPISAQLFLTGSYDEHIRLYRLPEATAGALVTREGALAEAKLDGGVWRLKLLDTPVPRWEEQYDILCSCMHAGVRIVRLSKTKAGNWRFSVLAAFTKHQSMNYGSDFQPGWASVAEAANERVVVSTSYYDKLVCAWKVTVP